MNNEKDILNSLPPFHVGQRVVALNNQLNGDFKKGDVFTCTRVYKASCNCWTIDIDNPINSSGRFLFAKCSNCGASREVTPGYVASRFAPLQSQSFPLITLSKVIEEQHELVSSN